MLLKRYINLTYVFFGFTLIFVLNACQSDEACKPLFNDWRDVYVKTDLSFNQIVSKGGKKHDIFKNISRSNQQINNGDCVPYKALLCRFHFWNNDRTMIFELEFHPSTEANVISFEQHFAERQQIRSIRYHYAVEKKKAYFFSKGKLDGINSIISMDVEHKELDFLSTQYGIWSDVIHITNHDVGEANKHLTITDIYLHKKNGILRFDTADGEIWEFGPK